MEFLLKSSTYYLTSGCNEWVRYKVEHLKRNSMSTRSHVLFCSLYKHTNYNFPKISGHLRKISTVSQKVSRISDKHFQVLIFQKFSEDLPKILDHCWRLPRKIQRCLDHTNKHILYSLLYRYITSCYIINPSLTVAIFQYNVSSSSNLSFGVDKLSFLYSPWITLKKRTMFNDIKSNVTNM